MDQIMIDYVASYLASFETTKWFENVGSCSKREGVECVDSWAAAYSWAIHPISKWCSIEWTRRLGNFMARKHYDVFRSWNDVANTLAPLAQKLAEIARPHFPESAPLDISDWVQAQFMGVVLEIYYERYFESTIYRDQAQHYLDGRFPCGLSVDSEDAYPDSVVIMVF